ncbi:phosphatase PAP2 family protein [Alloscardovia theropitheci]|nr:phosphatase PAP2 family protein [Alloscardovia theropitheci]
MSRNHSTHSTSRARTIETGRKFFAYNGAIFGVIFVLLTAIVWPGLTAGFDLGITRSVVNARNGFFNVLAPLLSTIGGTAVVLVLAIVSLGILVWRKQWLQVKILFAALAGDVIIVTAFKRLVSRMRPDQSFWLGSVEDQQSFPSGHSANNTVLWLTLAIIVSTLAKNEIERSWARVFNVVAVLMPFFIGLSRIYVAHHWTTDVLAGWSLGIAWTSLVAWVYFGELAKINAHSQRPARTISSDSAEQTSQA